MLDMDQTVCPCCGSEVNSSDLPDSVEVAEILCRFKISRTPAYIFLVLWNAKGRIVTFETLLDMQDLMTRRDDSSQVGLRTSKKHLTKALRDYPVEIVPAYGMGYRLRILEDGWHWRNEPYL